MFFAGLFAMYFTIRSVAGDLWHERTSHLNVTLAAINTTILVISSVWCQLGVFKAEHGIPHRTGKLLEVGKWGMREWYSLTYLFGAIFVSGQIMEYATLHEEGISLDSDAYGSMFYITTGFHGIHVTCGLLAFLLIIGRTFTSRTYSHHQATGADRDALLLALRGRRVDRVVRCHLPPQVMRDTTSRTRTLTPPTADRMSL